MFGVIAMLGAMGAGNGMDLGALTGGATVALITALYGLVYSPSPYFYLCNTTSNTSWTRTLKVRGQGDVQDGQAEKV